MIRINNKNAIINNNCGRTKQLILLFKITMGICKNFFEMYRKLEEVPSKRFASLAIG